MSTLVLAPGCSSGTAAAIRVDQPAAFFDTPVAISITGLSANSTVVVRAETRDAMGETWSSFGNFIADAAGTVDLRFASSRAGSYRGVDAMGPFWSMTSATPSNIGFTFPRGGAVVKLTATVDGSVVASATLTRTETNAGVIGPQIEALSDVGFYGVYDAPANADKPRPGVLAFGGSGGGLSTSGVAYALATHGYPALAIAYFAEPGLPASLSSIPLEYFARALEWLRAQPAVDPSRVIVYGVSRGSEAALLLGANYPDLVHGVIALVPSNVAICSFPACNGPAWTSGGKSVPYTVEFDNPAPDDVPAAVIPSRRSAARSFSIAPATIRSGCRALTLTRSTAGWTTTVILLPTCCSGIRMRGTASASRFRTRPSQTRHKRAARPPNPIRAPANRYGPRSWNFWVHTPGFYRDPLEHPPPTAPKPWEAGSAPRCPSARHPQRSSTRASTRTPPDEPS